MPEFNLNFQAALDELGDNPALTISRELGQNATPFDELLPDREVASWQAEAGNITIIPTMAGLTAMDSPYNPVGAMRASDFSKNLAKISSETVYSERAQRLLLDKVRNLFMAGGNSTEAVERAVLDFANGVVVQAHRDTASFMKAQAIVNGKLDWLFNGIRLQVDYERKPEHTFPTRTGTAGYGSSASVFWADVRQARRLLGNRLRTILATSETLDMIISNPANSLDVVAQNDDGTTVTVRKYRGTLERPETDARYTVSLTADDSEVYMLDSTTPGATIGVPLIPNGVVVFVGNPGNRLGGLALSEDPTGDLGYTHIGPVIEAGGATGRWARVYTPETKPYQLRGEAVTNLMPLLTNPNLVVRAQSEVV